MRDFNSWMNDVGRMLTKLCGVDASMLPDYGYYDAFLARWTPIKTAQCAIKHAKSCF